MPELFLSWGFWFAVGAGLVAVAAALLITILLTARGIEKEAARALEACRQVEANTDAVWDLDGARDTLEDVRGHVDSLETVTGRLAGALHGEEGGARPAPGPEVQT